MRQRGDNYLDGLRYKTDRKKRYSYGAQSGYNAMGILYGRRTFETGKRDGSGQEKHCNRIHGTA